MWGRANTLRAQPSRALGRVHTLSAHITPRIGAFTSCAPTPTRVCGSVPYARPTAPCIGAFTPCAPPPTISRMRGRANTLRAHTTPRIGACPHPARLHHPSHWGCVHTFAPTIPRIGACPHLARPYHPVHWSTPCAPTPPRALGCVHTLRSHTTLRIGACSHPSRLHQPAYVGACPHPAHPRRPCIGACPHPARPHHPAY